MRRSTDQNRRPPSTRVGECSWKDLPDPPELIQSSEGGTTPPDPPELIQSSEGGTTPPDPPELIQSSEGGTTPPQPPELIRGPAARPLRSTVRGSAHTARDWCLGTRPPERAGIAAGTALADLEKPA